MNRINTRDEVVRHEYILEISFERITSFLKNVTRALYIIWIKITLSRVGLLRTSKTGATFPVAN
jgi:hypothetical protein